MKVMIALENRFYQGPSGNVYSNNVFDYSVWQRYLQVFDEVVVFARVGHVDTEPDKPTANGPGVSIYPLPVYLGPWQYLKKRKKIVELAGGASDHADAFILRVPGTIGSLLQRRLRKTKIPYGVEVVGDPKEALDTCGVNFLAKIFLKSLYARRLKRECKQAVAAAYVSQNYLQSKYPPRGWSTHYSSIDLRDDDILTEKQLEKKIQNLQDAFSGKRTLRICHAGTMAARYKGQDVLIEAVAKCIEDGINIELVLMGDGKFRSFYEQKVAQMGIEARVKFLGSIPAGEAVRAEFDKSDMLVLPSLTEGLPRTIIEAMARGLPCVASRVGGIPEIVDKQFLVRPKNSKALAEKINSMVNGHVDIEPISKDNISKAREFRFEILKKRRIKFYKKVAQASLHKS